MQMDVATPFAAPHSTGAPAPTGIGRATLRGGLGARGAWLMFVYDMYDILMTAE